MEIAPTIQEGQIDLEQWEHRLSLRAADRIRENDRFARFVEIVQRAGKDAVGRDA